MFINRLKLTTLLGAVLAIIAAAGLACRDDERPTQGKVPVTVECGASLGLGPGDAQAEDWAGTPRPWALVEDPATERITLTRSGSCGDECGFSEELVLAPGRGSCPDFVSARRITADHGSALGVARDTVETRSGTLTIQDWSYPGGPVSGKLTGNLEMSFYVTAAD